MFRWPKVIRLLLRYSSLLVFIAAVAFNPCASQAKTDDDQTQIILLNDSAAALEDSDPDLSKAIAQFADEKEKEWEYRSANKNAPPTPVIAKDIPQLQYRIKILTAAAIAIKPAYPLIAHNLYKMAQDLNRIIENEE
jgi:hypothetical protein